MCKSYFKLALYFLVLPLFLCARQVDTFYGTIEVEEPLLLELIDSPAFQRLKHIHQYGVSYYTTHREEYNRYDHSLGVFTILRVKGASLEEQIAGLLHDVSHTAFSHVGDWIFNKENQDKDYQNSIHPAYLSQSGLEQILNKHGYQIEQILPSGDLFPALENTLPNLCADRIDYNIQGAYYQGFLTYEEALILFKDLRFDNLKWISSQPELMKKLTRFSLFMTQDCWGSPINYVTSRWLADAILRAIEIGSLSSIHLHFGTDQAIWNLLINHSDEIIQMYRVLHARDYITLVDPDQAALVVKSKFRGINPWISLGKDCQRLTELDGELALEFEQVQQVMRKGWGINFSESAF